MSLIKNDARAAIPSEYSANDPRNPNRANENSLLTLSQITSDATYDNRQKSSLRCRSELIEEFADWSFIHQKCQLQQTFDVKQALLLSSVSTFGLLVLVLIPVFLTRKWKI